MRGITREELERVKKVNLKEYLLATDPDSFRTRDNGTLVWKADNSMVIYDDHAYIFAKVAHAYLDNVGALRRIYEYDFMEAVNKLQAFKDNEIAEDTLPFYENIPDGIDSILD